MDISDFANPPQNTQNLLKIGEKQASNNQNQPIT